jgi:hypothetical protein
MNECETLLLFKLRTEQRLGEFEATKLNRIFTTSKRKEVTGGWRKKKLGEEKPHNFHSSRNRENMGRTFSTHSRDKKC